MLPATLQLLRRLLAHAPRSPHGVTRPRRLILVQTEEAPSVEDWSWGEPACEPWEQPLSPLTASALPTALRPLYAHRERLTALYGLRHTRTRTSPAASPMSALGPAVSEAVSRDDSLPCLHLSDTPASLADAWRELLNPSTHESPLDQRLTAYAQGRLSPHDRLRFDLHLPRAITASPQRSAAELIAASFALDLTRCASLSLPQAALPSGGSPAEALSQLVATLEAIPEGEGSLMDHCLIAWGAAEGPRFPALLLGGGWAYRGGRALGWPSSAATGRPHQRLLVSIARAMGLEIEALGEDHLWTDDGVLIDLTGELFELY